MRSMSSVRITALKQAVLCYKCKNGGNGLSLRCHISKLWAVESKCKKNSVKTSHIYLNKENKELQ